LVNLSWIRCEGGGEFGEGGSEGTGRGAAHINQFVGRQTLCCGFNTCHVALCHVPMLTQSKDGELLRLYLLREQLC
jgi:hypothetical protein